MSYRCKEHGKIVQYSSGIDGGITAGHGDLDDNGYWEVPCTEGELRYLRRLESQHYRIINNTTPIVKSESSNETISEAELIEWERQNQILLESIASQDRDSKDPRDYDGSMDLVDAMRLIRYCRQLREWISSMREFASMIPMHLPETHDPHIDHFLEMIEGNAKAAIGE